MPPRLRPDTPPDCSDDVVIHMGAGTPNLDRLLESTINNYDVYIGVHPDEPHGAFALSVFIALTAAQEAAVLAAMPHGQFGRARIQDIDGSHAWWPTSFDEHEVPEEVRDCHWDIVISCPELPELPDQLPAVNWSQETRDAVSEALRPYLAELLATFDPRVRKT